MNIFKKIMRCFCCRCKVEEEDFSEYVDIIDTQLRSKIVKDNSPISNKYRTISSFDRVKPTMEERMTRKFSQI